MNDIIEGLMLLIFNIVLIFKLILITNFSDNEKLTSLFEKYGELLIDLCITFFIFNFAGLPIVTNLCIVIFSFIVRMFIIIKNRKDLNYYFTFLIVVIGFIMYLLK